MSLLDTTENIRIITLRSVCVCVRAGLFMQQHCECVIGIASVCEE